MKFHQAMRLLHIGEAVRRESWLWMEHVFLLR